MPFMLKANLTGGTFIAMAEGATKLQESGITDETLVYVTHCAAAIAAIALAIYNIFKCVAFVSSWLSKRKKE